MRAVCVSVVALVAGGALIAQQPAPQQTTPTFQDIH
jgi:hypothetical protein